MSDYRIATNGSSISSRMYPGTRSEWGIATYLEIANRPLAGTNRSANMPPTNFPPNRIQVTERIQELEELMRAANDPFHSLDPQRAMAYGLAMVAWAIVGNVHTSFQERES